MSVPLLPFQSQIVSEVHDPSTSDLLILAHGLGLRKIICSLLKIYSGPKNLILLVGAYSDEDSSIGSQLSTMGVRNPGLRIVSHEMPKKERTELYRKGGLISVTSRILIVDMLLGDIPIELITGVLILHAERVSPSSPEAFIARLYRESNKQGFLKAFSDQPERFTMGMTPLQTIMKELFLRRVHIYPRFQKNIQDDLKRRKADVIELHQKLNANMLDIHDAIVQCMIGTLAELKKSNATLDLDDLNVDNAYFRSFDALVRRQLDPVWHKVGMRTKQLVGDLGTLRRLLTYLLSYDPITFLSYLETIHAASIIKSKSSQSLGGPAIKAQMTSPWLMSDAAHIMFTAARRRCYIQRPPLTDEQKKKAREEKEMERLEEMMDEEQAMLDEMEGRTPAPRRERNKNKGEAEGWKEWMPSGMEPVLEELPKWRILNEVLVEIEETLMTHPPSKFAPGSNTTLIMAADLQTCTLIRDFLTTKHLDPDRPGRPLLESRLRTYLYWKKNLMDDEKGSSTNKSNNYQSRPGASGRSTDAGTSGEIAEGLKRKDAGRAAAYANRRRVRGGGPTSVASSSQPSSMSGRAGRDATVAPMMEMEMDDLAEFYSTQPELQLVDSSTEMSFPLPPGSYTTVKDEPTDASLSQIPSTLPELSTQESTELASMFEQAFSETHFGMIPAEETIIVRPYGDDDDDVMLSEVRPRWIIMYDPNQEFIRRVEVYKSSNLGLAVRLYFMLHQETSEEHKFLLSLRREKNAFERLIEDRGNLVLPLLEAPTSVASVTTERLLEVMSTRNAGGQQKSITSEPPRILVDMREFRSSLPNLLHKARNQVIPLTLTVGDYILTPEICVERKSLPDLVQSFGSGRLYSQCELMSLHYKQPVLLIEFEENKAFSMQTISDTQTGPMKKYTDPKKKQPESTTTKIDFRAIQSRLVLLTLAFPRLRIIWSSSPHLTAMIFADLKLNSYEPDPTTAITIGTDAEGTVEGGESGNLTAEELLRSLPGVGTKNYKSVMSKVGSVRELCELSLADVQAILGAESGKLCYDFLHKGLKN